MSPVEALTVRAAVAAVALILTAARPVAAEPGRVDVGPGELDVLRGRLAGLTVRVAQDGAALWIDDVAGEGAPHVGVIVRRGRELVLVTDEGEWRLTGPLARPRIAGPGYTVWLIGVIMPADRGALRIRRLGVLRRPAHAG